MVVIMPIWVDNYYAWYLFSSYGALKFGKLKQNLKNENC